MSSITKQELLAAIDSYPDDAEVILEIRERMDGDVYMSIAYINGVRYDEIWNEIRLMN